MHQPDAWIVSPQGYDKRSVRGQHSDIASHGVSEVQVRRNIALSGMRLEIHIV